MVSTSIEKSFISRVWFSSTFVKTVPSSLRVQCPNQFRLHLSSGRRANIFTELIWIRHHILFSSPVDGWRTDGYRGFERRSFEYFKRLPEKVDKTNARTRQVVRKKGSEIRGKKIKFDHVNIRVGLNWATTCTSTLLHTTRSRQSSYKSWKLNKVQPPHAEVKPS